MLCDPGGDVLRSYGVRGFTGMAKRVSFLIDADGRVAKVYGDVSPARHAAEVLNDVREITGPR